jgi:hypothetical protein
MINIKAIKFTAFNTILLCIIIQKYKLRDAHSNLRDSIKPLAHTQGTNIWIAHLYFNGNMKCDRLIHM